MKARFVIIAGVLLALTLAACGVDETPQSGSTPPPSDKKFTETEWTVTTPGGWVREDITKDADGKKAIKYSAADGSYFIVVIDPLGSDFVADAVWRYDVKGSGFEAVEKENCIGTEPESQCSTDDSRYDVYVMWKTGSEPVKVGGHTWYFILGNDKSATADTAGLEKILESVTVTA